MATIANNFQNNSSVNFHNKYSNLNKDPYGVDNIKLKIIQLQKEIQVHKLKLNLIFFYEERSKENVEIYNRLKLEVLGGFFGVQDVNILKKLLLEIKNLNSSFILITTGFSFHKINNLCIKLNGIKDIIIYCMDIYKYELEYEIWLFPPINLAYFI